MQGIDDQLLRMTRRVSDRFRSLSRVADVLLAVLPDTDEGSDLRRLQKDLESRLNELSMHDARTLAQEVPRIEAALSKVEHGLERLDSGIPMGWFREHFDASSVSSVALVDYAALLGRHANDNLLRLDRIQFLLTRVVSFFLSPEEASPERRKALLEEALPPVAIDEATRRTAVAFLRDAAQRVTGFSSLQLLVDSGFFIDVRGYKLSLRAKLLDPEVMTAAIELNEVINDNMHRLAAADTEFDRHLEVHLASVDAHLKGLFHKLRDDESAAQTQFDRWVARNAAKRSPATTSLEPAKKTKTAPVRPLLAVALFVFLIVAYARWPKAVALKELSKAEVVALSPLLVSGTAAPKQNPQVFVGRVDKSRWTHLTLVQRNQEAEGLATRLTERGLHSGTVMLEQQVVIQINRGKILLVQ